MLLLFCGSDNFNLNPCCTVREISVQQQYCKSLKTGQVSGYNKEDDISLSSAFFSRLPSTCNISYVATKPTRPKNREKTSSLARQRNKTKAEQLENQILDWFFSHSPIFFTIFSSTEREVRQTIRSSKKENEGKKRRGSKAPT